MITILFELAKIEDEQLRNQAVELWLDSLSEEERQELEDDFRRLLVATDYVLTSLAENLRPIAEVIGEWVQDNPEVRAYLEAMNE